VKLDQARAKDFDALLSPGGVLNPDSLRMQPEAVKFVKAFFDAGKKVAAICHGPWSIIEAGVVKGRRIRRGSSRKPADLPAFNCEMVGLFARRRPAGAIADRKEELERRMTVGCV
jgi:protease I